MSDVTPESVRDDIEDALNYYDGDETMMPPAFQGLLEVARDWLASRSAPTDQEVERAAEIIDEMLLDTPAPSWDEIKRTARAALLAARQEGTDE